jgi:Protein of unknown function (DUF4232)
MDKGIFLHGNAGTQYFFENTSKVSCTLISYPALQPLDARHQPLKIQVTDSTSGYLYKMREPQVIILGPGKKAYFVISFVNISIYKRGCDKITWQESFLRITPVLATWDICSKTSRERALWKTLSVMWIRRKRSEWWSSSPHFYRTDTPSSQHSVERWARVALIREHLLNPSFSCPSL